MKPIKILGILLGMCWLGTLTRGAQFEELLYEIKDNEITITGLAGITSTRSIIIPDEIEARRVTSIADKAFHSNIPRSFPQEITLPNSLVRIGSLAFSNLRRLKEINIPSSVASIGAGAFLGCNLLEAITVDETNKHFTSLEGVLFTKNLLELFAYPVGTKQSTYSIPTSVTKIHSFAFSNSLHLSFITFPHNLEYDVQYITPPFHCKMILR